MASVEKRGDKWLVRWRDPDGRDRGKRCPTKRAAEALEREVEECVARGRRWEPPDLRPAPRLLEVVDGEAVGGIFFDYLAAQAPRIAAGTYRHYDRALRRFAAFAARRRGDLRAEALTRDVLEAWFGELVRTLDVSTARLYVGAVYGAWEWADSSDSYADAVARPRRFQMPSPARAPAVAPTWDQMDAAIAVAYRLAMAARTRPDRIAWVWRGRLCTLMRFTGVRVDEQAMRIEWPDVDLDRKAIAIRGELGKSQRERAGREIPISPHLAELMAGWGPREGFVIAPHLEQRSSPSEWVARLWEEAAVPERVWKAGRDRKKGQPQHAFRKGFKTGLSRLGVDREVRDFLVGHHRGIDDHYLDSMEEARAAVGKIPALADDAAAGEVIALPRARG